MKIVSLITPTNDCCQYSNLIGIIVCLAEKHKFAGTKNTLLYICTYFNKFFFFAKLLQLCPTLQSYGL